MTIPEPQPHMYAVVDHTGKLSTEAPSGRWAFRTLDPAAQRAHADRQTYRTGQAKPVRVARYKFDGWAA